MFNVFIVNFVGYEYDSGFVLLFSLSSVSIGLHITARRLREKALPDEFRPEGSVPESGHIVSEAGKGGYGAVFAPSRAAGFAIAVYDEMFLMIRMFLLFVYCQG